MKGINFKKAFLLSGILLLSVFVVIQLSWGCDDYDKWGCDDHDKWDCEHECWPCNPPKIQIVYLTYPDGLIEFTILGKNFDNGTCPVVTLGGMYKLNVEKEDFSDIHIIATLPLKDLKEEFKYGDYRLVVSTCHDSACEYKYCKDYCFKCKDKHCRDYCSKCKDRYCKDKYCKDHEYECKCKDRYSLTIANPEGQKGQPGPPGPAGPAGVSGYERIAKEYLDVALPTGTSITYAACPAGKTLVGGGGGVSENYGPGSTALKPVMIYNGPDQNGGEQWNIKWFNGKEDPIIVDILVYAICADISQ
jgi:hypothetical protein